MSSSVSTTSTPAPPRKSPKASAAAKYKGTFGFFGLHRDQGLIHNRNSVRLETLQYSCFLQPFEQIFIQRPAIVRFLTGDDVLNSLIVQGIRLDLLAVVILFRILPCLVGDLVVILGSLTDTAYLLLDGVLKAT